MDVNVYHFGFAVKHNTVLNNGDGKLQKLLYIMQLSLSLLLAQKLGQDGQRALSITGTPTWRSWPCVYRRKFSMLSLIYLYICQNASGALAHVLSALIPRRLILPILSWPQQSDVHSLPCQAQRLIPFAPIFICT